MEQQTENERHTFWRSQEASEVTQKYLSKQHMSICQTVWIFSILTWVWKLVFRPFLTKNSEIFEKEGRRCPYQEISQSSTRETLRETWILGIVCFFDNFSRSGWEITILIWLVWFCWFGLCDFDFALWHFHILLLHLWGTVVKQRYSVDYWTDFASGFCQIFTLVEREREQGFWVGFYEITVSLSIDKRFASEWVFLVQFSIYMWRSNVYDKYWTKNFWTRFYLG